MVFVTSDPSDPPQRLCGVYVSFRHLGEGGRRRGLASRLIRPLEKGRRWRPIITTKFARRLDAAS